MQHLRSAPVAMSAALRVAGCNNATVDPPSLATAAPDQTDSAVRYSGALEGIRDAAASCTGPECGSDHTTRHVEFAIRGPNPFENVETATEQLSALVDSCATSEGSN